MIKKIFAKLMNFSERRENLAKSAFNADRGEQERLARERHEQIMRERGEHKYVSERTVPTEGEIVGPSESKTEEAK